MHVWLLSVYLIHLVLFANVDLALESLLIPECSYMLCFSPFLFFREPKPGEQILGCVCGNSHYEKAAFTECRLWCCKSRVPHHMLDIEHQCLQTVLSGFRIKQVASLRLGGPLTEIFNCFVGQELLKSLRQTSALLEEMQQAQSTGKTALETLIEAEYKWATIAWWASHELARLNAKCKCLEKDQISFNEFYLHKDFYVHQHA